MHGASVVQGKSTKAPLFCFRDRVVETSDKAHYVNFEVAWLLAQTASAAGSPPGKSHPSVTTWTAPRYGGTVRSERAASGCLSGVQVGDFRGASQTIPKGL